MSDNDSSIGRSTLRSRRVQRATRQKEHPTIGDADEAVRIHPSVKRKTHREVIASLPPLPLRYFNERLPHALIRDMSPDDVCKETMVLVDLLGNDAFEII